LQVDNNSQDEDTFQEITMRLEKEISNIEGPELTMTEVVAAPLTPDNGMLIHSGALEFVPDTGMEKYQNEFDAFEFDSDLTFDQMVEAQPAKTHTQAEVREQFYETVVKRHVDQMFGWIGTTADLAVRRIFDTVLKDYVLNPNTYLSEFDKFRFRDVKIHCAAPTVMAHFIYSGIKTQSEEEDGHTTVCFASHFSSNQTSRCIEKVAYPRPR